MVLEAPPGVPCKSYDTCFLCIVQESLAVVFGTSVTKLAGQVVSIQWIRNLGEYGSPLEFVVPSIPLPG